MDKSLGLSAPASPSSLSAACQASCHSSAPRSLNPQQQQAIGAAAPETLLGVPLQGGRVLLPSWRPCTASCTTRRCWGVARGSRLPGTCSSVTGEWREWHAWRCSSRSLVCGWCLISNTLVTTCHSRVWCELRVCHCHGCPATGNCRRHQQSVAMVVAGWPACIYMILVLFSDDV